MENKDIHNHINSYENLTPIDADPNYWVASIAKIKNKKTKYEKNWHRLRHNP